MKPIYKVIVGGIAVIVFATAMAAGYGYWTLKSEVPPYGETIAIPGLEKPIEVIYDKWGVPHVFGGSEMDLARALGYLHARDRLWQMDLVRRAASGRLSELFGETLYKTDAFQRIIGLRRFAEENKDKLDPETLKILTAYADGVNHFIHTAGEHPSFEFRLLGYKMEDWQPTDTMALGRMTGWSLSANWAEEAFRLALAAERGEDVMWVIAPRHVDPGPYIVPPEEKKYIKGASIDIESVKYAMADPSGLIELLKLDKAARAVDGVPAQTEFASNSWVLAPKKTESGGAIMCNDPHLELLLPSVWHESHLVGDGINVTGVSFPGTPFIVLGHTPKIAWGATTTVADTQDLYVLKINEQNPDQYWYNGAWENFRIVEEKIKIRSKETMIEKTLKVRISRHGPVITDAPGMPENTQPLALRWAGYEPTNEVKAIFGMAKATTWDEFKAALNDLGVPVQNWVYADINGNIGYIANGLMPIREKSDGTMPVPGDDPAYEWKGFIPQDELPQLYNPTSGFVATANNKVVPPEDYPYVVSHRYAPPYRAMRIVEVLNSKEKFSAADMRALQMDVKAMSGARLAKYFIAAYEKKGDTSNKTLATAMAELKKWDFFSKTDSVGASVFFEAYRQAYRLTFEDEVSADLLDQILEERIVWTNFDNGIESDFALFDDRRTPAVEARDDILVKALVEAAKNLATDLGDDATKWSWGRLHTILFNHPFGKVDFMRTLLSKGPYPVNGSRDTVNNTYFHWFKEPYKVWQGPSLRHVVDFGRMDETRMTTTVGQSGHRLSPHYSDQVRGWIDGEYHPQPLTLEEAEKYAEGKIELVPAK